VAGLVFATLFVASIILLYPQPARGSNDAEIARGTSMGEAVRRTPDAAIHYGAEIAGTDGGGGANREPDISVRLHRTGRNGPVLRNRAARDHRR